MAEPPLNDPKAWNAAFPLSDVMLMSLWVEQYDRCLELEVLTEAVTKGAKVQNWDPHEIVVELTLLRFYAIEAHARRLTA